MYLARQLCVSYDLHVFLLLYFLARRLRCFKAVIAAGIWQPHGQNGSRLFPAPTVALS
jgi:hypothetical protein